MRLHGAVNEATDVLLELLHLPREPQVSVNVQSAALKSLLGNLDAFSESLAEAIQLKLAMSGQFNPGVLDLFDNRQNLLNGICNLSCRRFTEAGFSRKLYHHSEKLGGDLSDEEICNRHGCSFGRKLWRGRELIYPYTVFEQTQLTFWD